MKPQTIFLMLVLSSVVTGAETTTPTQIDDSLDQVIRTENFTLAQRLGDSSEGGQDDAARLQANARRIKTESRIGAKSMRRVMILAAWRQALNAWEDLELEIVHLQSGGGTLWEHTMVRNDLEIEEFLDGVADQLPLEESEPTPETERQIDELLKGALKRLDEAAKTSKKLGLDARQQTADIRRRLGHAHRSLKAAFRYTGNASSTAKLLQQCRDSSLTWKAMEEMDAK